MDENNQDVLFYVLSSSDELSRDQFITKLVNKINSEQRQADICLSSNEDCVRLEQAIWQYKPASFIPNSIAKKTQALIQLWDKEIQSPCFDVLLNLHTDFPALSDKYQRTIEILDQSEALIEMGRSRWKQYKSQGIEPTIHKIGSTP
jgi:DNA polymerase-3 subunit chi